MASYTEETYTAMDGVTVMTTYVFSDGEVWTKMAAPGRPTKVTRQDHEGDWDHRTSLKALAAKIDGQQPTESTALDGRQIGKDTTPVRLTIIQHTSQGES